MSRMPRVFEPGLANHLILRGNDRQEIVRSAADCRRLLSDLCWEVHLHGVAVHAYVVMPNHIHLMATGASAESIPLAMQGFGRRYVAYFNVRHGRSGTLWEGRYKASPIACNAYMFHCHRYIELNPVRAGLAVHPADYRWSSHSHYAFGSVDPMVTPHASGWGVGDAESVKAFRASFEESMASDVLARIRTSAERCLALGDEESCKRLEARIGVRVTPAPLGRRPAKAEDDADDRQGMLV